MSAHGRDVRNSTLVTASASRGGAILEVAAEKERAGVYTAAKLLAYTTAAMTERYGRLAPETLATVVDVLEALLQPSDSLPS